MRFHCALATLLASTAVADCPSAPQSVEEFRGQGVVIEFYDVSGETISEIRNSIREFGPRDGGNNPREGAFLWNTDWSWNLNEKKSLAVEQIMVFLHTKLVLPCWRKRNVRDLEVVERWDRYTAAMVRHEQQHAKHLWDNIAKIPTRVNAASGINPSMTERQGNRIVQAVLRRIRRLDEEYDRSTNHGRNEGVVW